VKLFTIFCIFDTRIQEGHPALASESKGGLGGVSENAGLRSGNLLHIDASSGGYLTVRLGQKVSGYSDF
jgi:hypothetical protein